MLIIIRDIKYVIKSLCPFAASYTINYLCGNIIYASSCEGA